MPLPEPLQHVRQRPKLFMSAVTFDAAVAFLNGYDVAQSGALMCGFREWLVVKVGCGNNLVWYALVLELAFPGAEDPRKQLTENNDHAAVIELMFDLLEQYRAEAESYQGLRRIHLRYENWLRQQEWYGPGSPDWVEIRRPRTPRKRATKRRREPRR